jgi:hypothetical protein
MNTTDSTREARLRRLAHRQGFALRKSRAGISVRNQGGFMIVDANANYIVAGEHYDLDLDDAERFLAERGR